MRIIITVVGFTIAHKLDPLNALEIGAFVLCFAIGAIGDLMASEYIAHIGRGETESQDDDRWGTQM